MDYKAKKLLWMRSLIHCYTVRSRFVSGVEKGFYWGECMLLTMQSFVRGRFYPLLMGMLAAGFLLLLLELIGYRHFGGLQLVGTGAVILGLVAALLGIGAKGGLRRGLIYLFLVLALTGLLGEWEHNEDRFGEERRPQAGQSTQEGQDSPQQGDGDQQSGPGGSEERTPPPILAPLSVSGLCLFGAIVLLSRRDDEDELRPV